MIDIKSWLNMFLVALNDTFGDRVWFVGLQGSYARGEATATSDIDMVVILDELSVSDILAYNELLDSLPHRELACGFLAGKNEILNWEPSDLFQFCHDTTPIEGSLSEVLSLVDESALNRAIKIGACNIYHGCVHNMLYEKSDEILLNLYKSASFLVQAIVFKKEAKYIRHQKDLLTVATLEEQTVINTFSSLKNGEKIDFAKESERLFTWSKNGLQETIKSKG